MLKPEWAELCSRVETCIAAGALEQARILVRRIHDSGADLRLGLYAKLGAAELSATSDAIRALCTGQRRKEL